MSRWTANYFGPSIEMAVTAMKAIAMMETVAPAKTAIDFDRCWRWKDSRLRQPSSIADWAMSRWLVNCLGLR